MEDITYIYNASGLVTEVEYLGHPLVKFFYTLEQEKPTGLFGDKRGGALANHRVKKETYDDNGILQSSTYYVRDVAGQVMAVYSDEFGNMALVEQPIYGAGRLGIAYNGNNNTKAYVYELTDHLGNVRAVFGTDGNEAGLKGFTDYYPGGMAMPNRNLEDANGYRYGYQGQYAEEDKETGLNAFQLRMYDSRINRWLSPDPYGQYNSPYLAMGNDWANGVDPDGGWKTKFGAWLWKTFNGGGEIVGEKGNWSVAQQGADGWDTFITNGSFVPEHRRDFAAVPGSGFSLFNVANSVETPDRLPIYVKAQADFNYGGFGFDLKAAGGNVTLQSNAGKKSIYSIGGEADFWEGDFTNLSFIQNPYNENKGGTETGWGVNGIFGYSENYDTQFNRESTTTNYGIIEHTKIFHNESIHNLGKVKQDRYGWSFGGEFNAVYGVRANIEFGWISQGVPE